MKDTALAKPLQIGSSTNKELSSLFLKKQRKVIDELSAENKRLRGEIEVVERERKRSTMEAIKQAEAQLAKGIQRQREENGDLLQQVSSAHREISLLKEVIREQEQRGKLQTERLALENRKMKEYVDTLVRTRFDALKVVAMEGMLKDMVAQLAKMTEKCSVLQLELDKREKAALRCHELMQRLERQSKPHAATLRHSRTRNEGSVTSRGELGLARTKIVKPVRGGAPAVVKVPPLKLSCVAGSEGGLSARESVREETMRMFNAMDNQSENSIISAEDQRTNDRDLMEELGRKVFG